MLKSADQPDKCRFSGAVLACEAVYGPFWNVHGYAVQGLEVSVFFDQRICRKNILHKDVPPLSDAGILPEGSKEKGKENSQEMVKILFGL